jgi:hypothetical protein
MRIPIPEGLAQALQQWTACRGGQTIDHLGDPARAQALHREALARYHQSESLEGIAWSLERLGITAMGLGEAERAARLFGAGARAREQSGAPAPPADQADLDRATETARVTLGPRKFERLCAEGRRMSAADAVTWALSP